MALSFDPLFHPRGIAIVGASADLSRIGGHPIKALKAAGWTITMSELSYRPKDYPELTDDQREEVTSFLQSLDEHDDVHRVHAAVK